MLFQSASSKYVSNGDKNVMLCILIISPMNWHCRL